jgi:DNA-binding NarL/FixJ family response regulator
VPIRIVLADDHYLVREGVAALIATESDLELLATCEDLDRALAAVEEHRPDVVITDIRMPPTGTDEGVRLAADLRRHHPGIGVVVLSQYVEPAYALALLEDGSAGRAYLLKERVSDIDELVAAVRAVASGGSWIDPKVVEALVATRSSPSDSPLRHLTPRELEVLGEIATGKNNAAIAEALVLSGRAVEKHINSIFSKLGLSEEPAVHRRVAAVLLFLGDAA